MKTFQDLQKVVEAGNEEKIIAFVLASIEEYKNSNMYNEALIAEEYYRHRNRTILEYQKFLYTLSGGTVPDNYSANFKIPSNHFKRFVKQQTQFLLGNGITWKNTSTKDKLGKDFDYQFQKAGSGAIVQAVTYGFWNYDHLEIFYATGFVPFLDETNGALMAGIRFWQIDDTKPLRAVLYEIDGYTDIIRETGKKPRVLNPKRTYKQTVVTTAVDGTQIYDGENYPTFPIIPCYCNREKQSEFVGMRSQIDAYDLIKSGFANDLDDASQIYWVMQNAGGMNDSDIALFLQRLKTLHAAIMEDDGATAEPHTIDIPYQAREVILTRLENDMYKDFMAMNPTEIAGGAVTATQIKAAYEPLNTKADEFEYCMLEFLDGILTVAGITDEDPTLERSMIINQTELIQIILQSALYLPQEYVTKKIMTILGDSDQADDAIESIDNENYSRMNDSNASNGDNTEERQEGNNNSPTNEE